MLDVIFREYDIRGLYGKELNEKSVKAIGFCLGQIMLERACKNVSVGYDARYSAKELFGYLLSGLNKAGIEVYDIGLVPTPLGYFSLYEGLKFDANIMITGSHNPKDYNGFKITIGKQSFFGAELKEFSKRVYEHLEDNIESDFNAKKYDILSVYIEFMCKQFSFLKDFNYNFVVDCANGAAGVVIEALVEALNLKAHVMFSNPDGQFPNHDPDPTEEKNLYALKNFLDQNQEYALAFAFDGDADRIVVLSQTHVFCGDELCYLFAKNIPNPRVLGEVKCSKNLFDEVAKLGTIFMGKTGHSNIKKMMKEKNIDLAAEVSGHIFFKHRYFGYDDGIYAFLRTLELVYKGFDLEAMIKALPKLYTTPEIKIPVSEEEKFKLVEEFKKAVEKGALKGVKSLCEIDGARIDFGDGWALLRASNTSPYLITRFEATSLEHAKELENMVFALFNQIKA
ncbi:phosphomannomutase/phosphoglucomutase [Campylobacter sp. VicNov18]|uniref:phosphomannomutase/phosphoglucomutase n=1 Tax=Campylobacter bilis TaxID=2691918 RepID=UPI00130DA60A|nr:phosphomannomutase/phosphoglucomutase [Campylobacter bilis]MPV64078.1 phosphomannomutase/phosphoglucomutase [Campylobacter hepaticus]MBM0637581.1 phosphomannomutase/phosphoglucomutase [Campylobacter bilis]MCC8278307.1 phosphomannomutase/phosphoglucomutase [Campylobacter bilis]MCC8299811.1 phosphomannomutase/phosphoglucomutase [Campylobacter bilis]MCC8301216.1 phosphomannomutase/phosphoglucomutase [Campylobacter bilis]